MFTNPPWPDFPDGMAKWSVFGKALETGVVSLITEMPPLLTACQPVRAALVPGETSWKARLRRTKCRVKKRSNAVRLYGLRSP